VAMPESEISNGACGKCIKVTYQGKSIVVKVADTCPECGSLGRIDLTQPAWESLESNTGLGLIPISWSYVSCGSGVVNDQSTDSSSINLPWGAWLGIGVAIGVVTVLIFVGIVLLVINSRRQGGETV